MVNKKQAYRRQLVGELYFASPLSCAELSERLHKSLPLTTRILEELMQEGWVQESGYAPSTGGRRPIMYALRPDVLYVLAVAMDQFVTRIALLDMHHNYVTPITKVELPLARNAEALSVLSDSIRRVVRQSGIEASCIAGVGIGMPGFVDVKRGVNYSFLETKGKSLTELLSEQVGLPVFIDNDSSLIALAELRFGAARGVKNAMIVNIGWGIGLGMVLNGELYRGHNGLAGEFSHLPLFVNGKLCSCGKRGCLETEASLLVVVEKARNGIRAGRESLLRHLLSEQVEAASELVIRAAQEGDQFAIELLSEAGYHIGRGVAILIHLLNPREVILSGRGSLAGRIWQAPIQQAINEHCIPKLAAHTVLSTSELGYQAELLGAASLVMDHYAKDPKHKTLGATGK